MRLVELTARAPGESGVLIATAGALACEFDLGVDGYMGLIDLAAKAVRRGVEEGSIVNAMHAEALSAWTMQAGEPLERSPLPAS